MANGISDAFIVGNLTRDPEKVSDKLLTFSVAVNRYNSSEGSDEPHYFDVKVLGNRASGLAGILAKGRGVSVKGDLVQERWEKDGQKRSAVRILAREVVLHGSKGDSPAPSGGQATPDDDSIPFAASLI